MQPGRFNHRRRGGGVGDADFVVIGSAAVATAVSFLLCYIVGHDAAADSTATEADTAWQVILAFATMSAGLLFIMHGMRVRDARPPAFVRRAVDAGAVLLHAGGPVRLWIVLILFICPFLEAWFDFI